MPLTLRQKAWLQQQLTLSSDTGDAMELWMLACSVGTDLDDIGKQFDITRDGAETDQIFRERILWFMGGLSHRTESDSE